MGKIGICGHFGGFHALLSGQIVKTRTITSELKKAFGSEAVQTVDTFGWQKHPVKLIYDCFVLWATCSEIIIMPGSNGIRIFVPIFYLLNKIHHRSLYYVVIGGWLPDLLKKHHLIKKLMAFRVVYVETHAMVETLNKIGLSNVKYLPNFKQLTVIDEKELVYSTAEPFKLCTFSRIFKEKGIEDAIKAVISVNDAMGRQAYSLDIYGQVEEEYKETFNELKGKFPSYISDKGLVDYNASVDILKEYFALLFPTYYEGEGFAGTILDGFAAGVPVIATNWKYNSEIIKNDVCGIIYDRQNPDGLEEILLKIVRCPESFNRMKPLCLGKAREYAPEIVLAGLIEDLK